jgi:hypothetical protein
VGGDLSSTVGWDVIDITNVDDYEVIAWNYGPNVTGTFTDDDANEWQSGGATTPTYTQTSSTTFESSTVDATFTTETSTLDDTAPAGTEAAFVADTSPTLTESPNTSVAAPPVTFASTGQFTLPSTTTTIGSAIQRQSDGTPEPYRVVIVNMSGVALHELPNAAVGPITWSLDEAESFTFQMPALDPLITHISATDTEVQVWRGEALLVWGVVVRPLVNGATVEYQCRGLAWYFSKRFVGGPRFNYLQNPSFETSGGWFYGVAPTEPPANANPANWQVSISSQRSVSGFPGRSQRIWSNNQMIFGIQAWQFIFHEIDVNEWPDGIKWTAAAWVYIPSNEWGFFDPEANKVVGERNAAYNWGGESAPFGLHLGRFSTTSTQEQNIVGEQYPEVYEITVDGLTEDLPRDKWVRLETSLVQPAPEGGVQRRTDWIQVSLHAPLGAVFYDEVSLTRNERLFFNDIPQEDILAGLVAHAQDTTFGKSNLNITFANVVNKSVRRTRSYEFFNREIIADAIDEFPSLWSGCDWSIETTGTTRVFTPWFPMKGTRRPAQALTLGVNIANVTIADDGEQIANRVVVRSDAGGTGSSREEAIGTDTTGFTGGLVLEEAINAQKESPLDSLEGQMQQAVRQKRNAKIPILTTHDHLGMVLFGQITTGDIVPVDVVYGGVDLQGEFRIVAITLNPDDETMDIAVNPFSDDNDPYLNLTGVVV